LKKVIPIAVIMVVISLLLFSCSRVKEFYGMPFGSTKEEVKTYLQNEKWDIKEQEEIIVATKANGKYAGKTVEEMSFKFEKEKLCLAEANFYKNDINGEPEFLEIVENIKKENGFNKILIESEGVFFTYSNGANDLLIYNLDGFIKSITLSSHKYK